MKLKNEFILKLSFEVTFLGDTSCLSLIKII